MSPTLHQALTDLAEETTRDDVPIRLAASAWADGRADLKRGARAQLVGLCAAAAAVLLIALVLVPAVVPRGVDAADGAALGYPQRVRFDADPDPLPAKGVRVSALIGSYDQDAALGSVDASRWQAVTPDGRVWRLDPTAAPDPGGGRVMTGTPTAPAVSADGRMLAVPVQVSLSSDKGSNARVEDLLRTEIHVHDLESGRHHVLTRKCTDRGPSCSVVGLAWSPDGSALAVMIDGEGQAPLLQVIAPDGTVIASTRGRAGGTLGRGFYAWDNHLLGWTSSSTVLIADVRTKPLPVTARGFDAATWTLDIADGDVRELALQRLPVALATSADEGRRLETGALSLVGGSFLALDSATSTQVVWSRSDLERNQFFNNKKLDWSASPGEPEGPSISTVRVLDGPRGGIGVVLAGNGTSITAATDGPGQPFRTRTVYDPALDIRDLVVATNSLDHRASASMFGTSTAWWAWHPWWATALAGTAALALLTLATVLNRRRMAARRTAPRASSSA